VGKGEAEEIEGPRSVPSKTNSWLHRGVQLYSVVINCCDFRTTVVIFGVRAAHVICAAIFISFIFNIVVYL